MRLSAHESGDPLFLLGSGRCGSTFWQTLLCRAPDTWIWGEHRGFLRLVLEARGRLLSAEGMLAEGRRAIAAGGGIGPDRFVGTDLDWALAWANMMTPAVFDELVRGFIDAYMRQGLPAGRTRWGFKEIRYGRENDLTPTSLLELFPGGTVIHTLRHPRASIESAMRAWHAPLLQRPGDDPEMIRTAYDSKAARWLDITTALVTLSDTQPERVITVRLEDIPAGRQALEARVGSPLPNDHPRINDVTRDLDEGTKAVLATAWEAWWPRLQAVAARVGYGSDGVAGPVLARPPAEHQPDRNHSPVSGGPGARKEQTDG